MTQHHATRLALAAALALGLSACGGGGGDADEPRPSSSAADDVVPASALSSWQTFLDYQKSLHVDDTIEPLKLQQLLPPTDDTIEPLPIG